MPGSLSKQKLGLINQSFLFANVDEIVVRRIIFDSGCTRQKYSKGSVIRDDEAPSGSLGIILSGSFRAEKIIGEGRALKLTVLRAGDCFGAAEAFSSRGHLGFRLLAERQAEVFFIPEETLRWALQRYNTVTENYIRYLSDQIWLLQNKIFSLSAGSAERRLAVYIADHCDSEGLLTGSMTDISRQLNLGRASLYRAIDKLEAENLILKSGKKIQVISPDGLRAFIDGPGED